LNIVLTSLMTFAPKTLTCKFGDFELIQGFLLILCYFFSGACKNANTVWDARWFCHLQSIKRRKAL